MILGVPLPCASVLLVSSRLVSTSMFMKLSGLYKNLGVEAVVIPAGDKPSVVGDAPQDYAKDTSPDKVQY